MTTPADVINPVTLLTLVVVGNPTSLATVSSPSSLAWDVTTNNFYFTNDGTDWVLLSGTGGSLAGTGSPVGVVNALYKGQFYTDFTVPTAPAIWVADGTGTGNWVEFVG